jgi:putative resolvase
VGVHYQTAWRWWNDGKLPVPAYQTASGTIVVEVPREGAEGRTVIYARVSSHDQRGDLDGQVARLTAWATTNGFQVDDVVAEVGSALSSRRRGFRRVLADRTAARVIAERRDRLARFGVDYLEAALSAQGRRIVIVDDRESDDELLRDMVEVLTLFCGRLYGRRGARNRALRAVTCAKRDPAGPVG